MRISDLSSDVCSSDLRFVEALGDRLHLLDRDLVALGMHAVAQRHVMHLDLDTFEILGHVDSSMSGGRATAAGRERGDSGMLRPGDCLEHAERREPDEKLVDDDLAAMDVPSRHALQLSIPAPLERRAVHDKDVATGRAEYRQRGWKHRE